MNRAAQTPTEAQVIRQRIRAGEYSGQTSGLASGHVQGNLAILPAARTKLSCTHVSANLSRNLGGSIAFPSQRGVWLDARQRW
jgi:hypothetical protein